MNVPWLNDSSRAFTARLPGKQGGCATSLKRIVKFAAMAPATPCVFTVHWSVGSPAQSPVFFQQRKDSGAKEQSSAMIRTAGTFQSSQGTAPKAGSSSTPSGKSSGKLDTLAPMSKAAASTDMPTNSHQIGRASCRERV